MKSAMLFPGYGSQYVGMAKELYDDSRLIQEYFEEASTCLNINFVKLCFASSDSELAKLEHAYVSIFLVSSSIAALLKQRGIAVEAMAGFDTGHYSALCAAGGLSFPDGLYFLSKYAQAYQDLLSTRDSGMILVEGISACDLDHACKNISQDHLSRAISYEHDVHSVAGDRLALGTLEHDLSQQGCSVHEMPVGAGLHADRMNPVLASLQGYIEKIDFKDTVLPVMMGLDGSVASTGPLIKEYSMKSIIMPLAWDNVVENLAPFDCLIEVGPGSTLSVRNAKKYPEKKIITINKLSDIDTLEKALVS